MAADTSLLSTGENGSDGGDAVVLMSGEVLYKDRSHQLLLTLCGLQLVRSPVAGNCRAATNSAKVLEVGWRRVLCACEAPPKKSKPSQSQQDSGLPGGGNTFIVHYSVKNCKTNKVQCRNVCLETKARSTGQWIAHIEEKCKQGKPRKLLIIINPIGGKGTARQTFEKRVQPLFALAGIELVVKVTERAKHAVEIAKTFDFSSVDGVIAVGGDGMYMEILHGLILRRQTEEGIDYDDPDATLCPPSVTVGIIPAGTGNGVSDWLNGVIDLETATLNIIRGESRRANILSVHESHKLIHYAGLLLGNGYFSHLIQRTDELRWMKRARYPYAAISSLLKRKQILEFDVEVLRNRPEQTTENGKAGTAEAMSPHSGWVPLGTKRMVAAMAFTAKVLETGDGSRLQLNPFYPGFDLFIIDKSSPLENLRLMLSFFTKNKQGLEKDYVEWVADIRGARFKMAAPRTESGAEERQRQTQDITELSHLLDVDGEVMCLSTPQFDVRLHPQFLPVFCAPELYSPSA